MSINIHVRGMNYNQLSCAQRAEVDKKRKKRLTQVREQSKEIAQQVREKVQCEKRHQIRKFQEIKKQEFENLKRRQIELLQSEYGHCLTNFGAAHIAACDASCEENEEVVERREEYDLMAAQRGRSAMLQEQRKRDREAEERLAKKKRKNAKSVSVQADLVGRRKFGVNLKNLQGTDEEFDENSAVRVENFTNKPNLHKSQATSTYNPKNYTSHSVDSSNNCDSEEEEKSSPELDSEVEFNQITNLLKQKVYNFNRELPAVEKRDEIVELSDSSESDRISQPLPPQRQKHVKLPVEHPKKKSILKTVPEPKVSKPKEKETERVNFLDFGNKYVSSYVPGGDLVTQNTQKTGRNAKFEAKIQEKRAEKASGVSDDVLRQLAEIRAQEALEKEKTRRDYEKLRLQLDDLSKEEQKAREASSKAFKNLATHQSQVNEQNRKARMNEAVENTMRRNIITCPPVDHQIKSRKQTCEVNVAAPHVGENSPEKPKKSNDDINNLVKVERLKDLLERINHQKKLLLREIEKSDEIPGPDLEQVIKCLEKLEKEKAAIDARPDPGKKKEIDELNAREKKVEEREKRLENKIRELYKSHKESNEKESVTSASSEEAISVPPVEIIIKVKSPRVAKHRKSFRVIDTLNREPKKVYPRTPKNKEPEKVKTAQQQTQTSPAVSEAAPKTILKKSSDGASILTLKPTNSRKSDDSSSQSISTSYQSLPERINSNVTAGEVLSKPHHKLNPVLMHYVQRLLGMGKNIGNQLSVNVSAVNTPGSSTINTTGNNESGSEGQVPSFDNKRLEKLQEFINENYSFLSEINETLERSQLQDENEENINKVDGIWREVLRKKKPKENVEKEKNKIVEKKSKEVEKKPKEVEKKSQESSKSSQVTQKSAKEIQKPPVNLPKTAVSSQSSVRPQNLVPLARSQVQVMQRPQSAAPSRRPLNSSQLKLFPPPKQQKPSTSTQQLSTSTQPQEQTSQRPQITNRDMMNVTKYLESHIMNNYAEYTANCQKRIADLAQMMERVRHEKLKLIENSLSSGEFGHFTEYREIAVPGKVQDAPTTSTSDIKDSPSQREDPPSEEINNILQKQTRPFGVSKDSGISMISRPMTSSDFRDSPDVRVTSEERENTFQPILKDIPKPPRMKVTQEGEATEFVDDVSQLIKEHEEKAAGKKLKPPLSLNRFSPHLEKPHEAHELSTIAEVETPSASKVNLHIEESGVGGIESFPNFEEYAKKMQENADQSQIFPKLDEVMTELDEVKIKSFLQPREYGIPEISLENQSMSRASSTSSIIDVLDELKRRHLVTDEFKSNDDDAGNTTPTATQQVIKAPKSPKRKPAQSRIIIKTPENIVVEIQQDAALTPTKKRSTRQHHQLPESPQSNDTLSGIQEIEKEPRDGLDLQGMGMNWAASMMKRDGQSKNLLSSSSSSSMEKGCSIQIEIETNKSTSSTSSSNGQPLNLREFLARELMKRSRVEKSISDDSSLSSQFMRSLLNASSGPGSTSGNTSDHDKLRTSTPVHTKGSSSHFATLKSGGNSLFPGDSLSTLKGSDRDSDKSNEKERRESN